MKISHVLIGTIALLLLPSGAFAAKAVDLKDWTPKAGDQVMVDLTDNRLYVLHADNSTYLSVPAATGQKRTVSYIGITYYAATPQAYWEVESVDWKGKSVTFGERGLFLRLYRNGKEKSSYGIHSHRSIAEMLAMDPSERYRSMGCILVAEDVLEQLRITYELNNQLLPVRTVNGLEEIQKELQKRDGQK